MGAGYAFIIILGLLGKIKRTNLAIFKIEKWPNGNTASYEEKVNKLKL